MLMLEKMLGVRGVTNEICGCVGASVKRTRAYDGAQCQHDPLGSKAVTDAKRTLLKLA